MKKSLAFILFSIFILAAGPVFAKSEKAPSPEVIGPGPMKGEGGGSGAARVPENFELNTTSEMYPKEDKFYFFSKDVLEGTLKVKGLGSNKSFYLVTESGTVQLVFAERFLSDAVALKNKSVKVEGFYNFNLFVVKEIIE